MAYSTKQDFMKDLKRALRRYFTPQETQDILADYDGFYDSDTQLGNPKDIALELANSEKRKQRLPQWLKIALHIFMVAFAGGALYAFPAFVSNDFGNAVCVLISAVYLIVIAVMWFAFFSKSVKSNTMQIKAKIAIITCHALLSASVIAEIILVQYVFGGNEVRENALTLFINYAMSLPVLIMPLVFSIIAVVCFHYNNKQWFTVVTHGIGTLLFWSMPTINVMYLGENFPSPSYNGLIVYGLVIITTILFALLIRKKGVT